MGGLTDTHRERAGEVARVGDRPRGRGPARIEQGRSDLGYWWEDVKRRARNIPRAAKTASPRELAERATGMFGTGILKPVAVGRVLGKGAKIANSMRKELGLPRAGYRPSYAPEKGLTPWITSVFKAPQRELSRVKNIIIKPGYELGGVAGRYIPTKREIELFMSSPVHERANTFWHELTHARQYLPSTSDHIDIRGLRNELIKLIKAKRKSSLSFYLDLDPIEIMARGMGRKMPKVTAKKAIGSRLYDRWYASELERSYNLAIKRALEEGLYK